MENNYNQPNDYAGLSIALERQQLEQDLFKGNVGLDGKVSILSKTLNRTEIPLLLTDKDKERYITELLELLIQKGLRAKFLG